MDDKFRLLVIDAARAVLVARSNDRKVRWQIAKLLGRLDNDLSEEQVLEKLKALRAGAPRRVHSMEKDRAKPAQGWKFRQRLLRLLK